MSTPIHSVYFIILLPDPFYNPPQLVLILPQIPFPSPRSLSHTIVSNLYSFGRRHVCAVGPAVVDQYVWRIPVPRHGAATGHRVPRRARQHPTPRPDVAACQRPLQNNLWTVSLL